MAKTATKSATASTAFAPKMYEKQYQFSLVGISPLIQHRDSVEWADEVSRRRQEIKENDKAAFIAGDDRCPPETWKGYMYHDDKVVAMCHENLHAGLIKAAAKLTLKRQETFKRLVASSIVFSDEFYPLLVNGLAIPWAEIVAIKGTFAEQAEAVQKFGFRLFVKRAAVSSSKHVRVRPRLDVWSAKGIITVTDPQITTALLTQMWYIHGRYIGQCDWRPGSPKSPGAYGRFDATITEL